MTIFKYFLVILALCIGASQSMSAMHNELVKKTIVTSMKNNLGGTIKASIIPYVAGIATTFVALTLFIVRQGNKGFEAYAKQKQQLKFESYKKQLTPELQQFLTQFASLSQAQKEQFVIVENADGYLELRYIGTGILKLAANSISLMDPTFLACIEYLKGQNLK